MSVSITLGEIASREVCATGKRGRGETPPKRGRVLGVTRGETKGVVGTGLLVVQRGKGGCVGTSTFFSIGTWMGVMTHTTYHQCISI
jgi:hypothetical protein